MVVAGPLLLSPAVVATVETLSPLPTAATPGLQPSQFPRAQRAARVDLREALAGPVAPVARRRLALTEHPPAAQ